MPFTKLLWARYSAFLPLYPLGVASELTMVWLALPTIESGRPWSLTLPNAANFAFDYYWLCIILSVIYIPGALPSSKFPNGGPAPVLKDLIVSRLCNLQVCHTCTCTC